MNAPHGRAAALLVSAVAMALVVACGQAVSTGSRTGNGQLAVELVDAPAPAVDAIWVNVTKVTAHSTQGGWFTVSTSPLSVDLLKLQDAAASLGLVSLPPGTITQVRLVVSPDGNHVTVGGQDLALKVPSGSQSGIKVHGPWEVTACNKTALTLDFDGKNSIFTHPTGHGEEWILRPVIRVKKAEVVPVPCDDETPDGGAPPATCGEGLPTCPDGQLCVESTCKDLPPQPCILGAECVSGTCDPTNRCAPGGSDTPCATGPECLSGVCDAGSCVPGLPGDSCRAGSDCESGTCSSETGSCAPGGAGGAGQPCTSPAACYSGSCTAGACDPGVQGKPCAAPADCMSELCGAPAPGAELGSCQTPIAN